MKEYYIHDNRARPFKVSIQDNNALLYKGEYNDYSDLVKQYKIKDKWIGKSSGTVKTSDHKKKDAKNFIGNSIILQLTKTKYVYIGDSIYEFELPDDDIKKYYSPVGNNDVPYPVIVGSKNVFFMLDKKYVDKDEFPPGIVWEDAYMYFYGHVGESPLEKKAHKMKGIQSIHSRF